MAGKLGAEFSISAISRALGVSRSSLYYQEHPHNQSLDEARLTKRVIHYFNKSNGVYGARKIRQQLLVNDAVTASRRHIRRIMRQYGLVSVYTKQLHRKSSQPKLPVNNDATPDLVKRQFTKDQPLAVVVCDLTYVRVDQQWSYLCPIVDLWNREIIGWSIGFSKSAELVRQAIATIPYPLDQIGIFHTDRGGEFRNQVIDSILDQAGITRSLSRKGTPIDNAVIESTNNIIKTEFTKRYHFRTIEDLRLHFAHFVHWYNHHRLHGSINYQTPMSLRQELPSRAISDESLTT